MTFKADEGWEEPILSIIWRWILTLALCFVLLVLSMFPFRIGVFDQIRPSFMIMAIYYWTVMRPATLSPVAVFLMGLVFDLLAGTPLGMTALTLVLAQWMTRAQRKFLLGQPFLVTWAGLGLVATAAGLLDWGVICLLDWKLWDLQSTLMGALVTTAVFPLAVLPLSALNKSLADRDSPL